MLPKMRRGRRNRAEDVYLTLTTPSEIRDILGVLEKYDVKRLFRLRPDSYEPTAAAAHLDGRMPSALHSWSHKYATSIPPEAGKRISRRNGSGSNQLRKAQRLSAAGGCGKFHRDSALETILAEIEAEDLTLCAWNVDAPMRQSVYFRYEIVRGC
jgi:hypothetical protein